METIAQEAKRFCWKPIEAAPRNFSDILVFIPDSDDHDDRVIIAYWEVDYGHWVFPGLMWAETPNPTHWMPLPDPPK